MASYSMPSLVPEIGPDGIARESPVIAYTEKVIEEEQLLLERYIQENYSKIRDVERELENLTLELKLTAGRKRAALEHMRKKIELVNERLRAAKLKEEQAKKDGKSVQPSHSNVTASQKPIQQAADSAGQAPHSLGVLGIKNAQLSSDGKNQQQEVELREKMRISNPARVKKNIIPKGRAASDSGWTYGVVTEFNFS